MNECDFEEPLSLLKDDTDYYYDDYFDSLRDKLVVPSTHVDKYDKDDDDDDDDDDLRLAIQLSLASSDSNKKSKKPNKKSKKPKKLKKPNKKTDLGEYYKQNGDIKTHKMLESFVKRTGTVKEEEITLPSPLLTEPLTLASFQNDRLQEVRINQLKRNKAYNAYHTMHIHPVMQTILQFASIDVIINLYMTSVVTKELIDEIVCNQPFLSILVTSTSMFNLFFRWYHHCGSIIAQIRKSVQCIRLSVDKWKELNEHGEWVRVQRIQSGKYSTRHVQYSQDKDSLPPSLKTVFIQTYGARTRLLERLMREQKYNVHVFYYGDVERFDSFVFDWGSTIVDDCFGSLAVMHVVEERHLFYSINNLTC
jgi:hypothetical protein